MTELTSYFQSLNVEFSLSPKNDRKNKR